MSDVDPVLLEEVLGHIHNWFERGSMGVSGISGGALPDSVSAFLVNGQWYRIQGSLLNDGLHTHPADDLEDEEFRGTVTSLAIPRPLLQIVLKIAAWIDKYGDASNGPYASESFGGYSYSVKTDSSGSSASGGLSGWRLAFRDRLNPWRKIS